MHRQRRAKHLSHHTLASTRSPCSSSPLTATYIRRRKHAPLALIPLQRRPCTTLAFIWLQGRWCVALAIITIPNTRRNRTPTSCAVTPVHFTAISFLPLVAFLFALPAPQIPRISKQADPPSLSQVVKFLHDSHHPGLRTPLHAASFPQTLEHSLFLPLSACVKLQGLSPYSEN